MKLLFCSDIHGNTMQYAKILEHAKDFDALIFGGDLCPKGLGGAMNEQLEFLKGYLIPALENLKEKKPELKIYLMLGNDDWAGNLYYLSDFNGELFHILTEEKVALNNDFDIVGYPFVPITPFRIKDWEKWDLGDKKKRELVEMEKNILLQGFRTYDNRYEGYEFDLNDYQSIEKDMEKLFDSTKPEKTIYVFHSPPYNTNLDITYSGDHVGSLSIRMAIEGFQPFLTLHGHIHETSDMSGAFLDQIGDTLCASTSNHNLNFRPSVIEIELPKKKIRRVMLD